MKALRCPGVVAIGRSSWAYPRVFFTAPLLAVVALFKGGGRERGQDFKKKGERLPSSSYLVVDRTKSALVKFGAGASGMLHT